MMPKDLWPDRDPPRPFWTLALMLGCGAIFGGSMYLWFRIMTLVCG